MSTNDEAIVIQPDDHKRSYGRGGAGNMRLPSVVAAAQDEPELAKEAGTSSSRRKSSIVDKLLRRGSKDEEGAEKEKGDSGKGKQAPE
ncbi:hypothetical protein D0865_10357 [Hortaea werneckii]|uniref:Uncharacterized protein n=1 Tax=Hortaea werneckii TaxID=91943 RepID=A0A3M7BYE4_HORWE|nr:hypothetical protein D0865_10357 [Hortaea werneckii]